MLALLVGLVFQTPMALPENPSADYSGIPQITGGSVTMVTHAATIELYKDYALVSSVSQIHNDGGVGMVTVNIPRGRLGDSRSGGPGFAVTATWANAPITLTSGATNTAEVGKSVVFTNTLSGRAAMKAKGSYALRISYRVPLGRCGFDRKQFLAAYDMSSSHTIGALNVTYKFAKGVVFRLPAPKPDLGWQIGDRGAFVRLNSYDGSAGLSYLEFYSGGFSPIGN